MLKGIRLLFCLVGLSFLLVINADASHFRFGHLTWRRVSNNIDGSVTVEFTFVQAWRYDDGGDILSINTGDDGFIGVGAPGSGQPVEFTEIINFTDLFPSYTNKDLQGLPYTVRRYSAQYTYSAQAIQDRAGAFVAFGASCCRIGDLENASSDSEIVRTVVDLNSGNLGSPVSTIPVIVQMPVGQVSSRAIAVADPDGDPFSCRISTTEESSISNLASEGGKDISVSSNCTLSWDLTSTGPADVNKKYAVQVMIEETNHCGLTPTLPDDNDGDQLTHTHGAETVCGGVALDFIIELVEGNPPLCSADQPLNSLAFANQNFTVNFTGTDVDPNSTLTMTALGLPGGATINPASATSGPAPFVTTVNWTPTNADKNTAHALLISYQDEKGLEGTCSLSIEVPPNTPPACNAGGPYQLSCSGISASGTVSGAGSSDVDNDALTYLWSTASDGCGQASFSDATSASPGVSFVTETGSTTAKACPLRLTLSDGEFSSSCTADVTLLPCGACTPVSHTATIIALDGNITNQRNLVRDGTELLKANGPKSVVKAANKLIASAEIAYGIGWTAAWSLPLTSSSCASSSACTIVATQETIATYNKASADLRAISESVLKALNKIKLRKRAKRLRAEASAAYQRALDLASTVPQTQVVCPS